MISVTEIAKQRKMSRDRIASLEMLDNDLPDRPYGSHFCVGRLAVGSDLLLERFELDDESIGDENRRVVSVWCTGKNCTYDRMEGRCWCLESRRSNGPILLDDIVLILVLWWSKDFLPAKYVK
eukprot:scaffold11441_cov29-Cyclotella_meneghiniana.AAC.4